MSGWLNMLWGSSSPLQGKLNTLEMHDAQIGAEISKGVFGSIVEVASGKDKYAGQCLSNKLVNDNPKKTAVLDNFPSECTRISCLDHRNVINMCGVVFQSNSLVPVLVTEKLGPPLSKHLLEKSVEPNEQLTILGDIVRGLQYIHSLSIPVLHLCLTPDNVVLVPGTATQAKICNAGIVKLLQLTPSWCRSYIPNAECFLPPSSEAEDAKPVVSFDIFSLGALMIQVLLPHPEPIPPPVFLQDPNDPNEIVMDTFVTFNKVMSHGANSAILCKVLESHPMYSLIQKCLMKSPAARPTAARVVEDLESAKENALEDMIAWEADIKKKTAAWLEESNTLSVAVIGKTGAGKTSLINGLLGMKVGKEGDTLSRGTTHVEKFESDIRGVGVTIWDTPGLQDGMCKDDEYLQQMVDSGCVNAHLKIYCISISSIRFEEGEIRALNKFTTVVGRTFWKNCLFVLTFANSYVNLCPMAIEPAQFLRTRVTIWKDRIKEELLKSGVDESVVQQISVVPAGYHSPLKGSLNPWVLPGIDNWFYTFWYTCADVMDRLALPALVKANRRRFQQDISDVDLQKSIEEVPIQLYRRGDVSTKARRAGSVVGISDGTGIGALVWAVVSALQGAVPGDGAGAIGANLGEKIRAGVAAMSQAWEAIYKQRIDEKQQAENHPQSGNLQREAS